MSLVFAGVCSHAPGITGRAGRADPKVRDAFYAKLDEMVEDGELIIPGHPGFLDSSGRRWAIPTGITLDDEGTDEFNYNSGCDGLSDRGNP